MVEAIRGTLRFHIKGERLKKMDWFSQSDPICMVEYINNNNQWVVIG